jgi:hypothetical protein
MSVVWDEFDSMDARVSLAIQNDCEFHFEMLSDDVNRPEHGKLLVIPPDNHGNSDVSDWGVRIFVWLCKFSHEPREGIHLFSVNICITGCGCWWFSVHKRPAEFRAEFRENGVNSP